MKLKKSLGCGIASISGAVFFAANPVNAALIHHWDFDEGSGAIAGDSAGGNNGAISGATWGSDGTRASYLSFDGDTHHVDPSLTLPLMTTTNDFTWAFWSNSQEAINGEQQNAIIVGNRKDGLNVDFAPREFIKFTPQQFEWHENAGALNQNVVYDNLVIGEWHHMAVVKTGANLQYYRDGVALGSGVMNDAFDAAMPFFIGGEPNQNTREHFNGFIDDVRLYDNALSAAEVLALIPEPSSALLCLSGIGFLAVRRRR